MLRNKRAVTAKINYLQNLKKDIPEVSLFKEPNHKAIDAMIDVLCGKKKSLDFVSADDKDDFIFKKATASEEWINGELDKLIFG